MRERKHHSIAGVFVFLVLGVFALMSMFLVLEGARAYKGTVNMTAIHNTQRIMHAYVRNAVRSEDCAGAVEVKELSGVPVIIIRQDMLMEEKANAFYHYIYCYDGVLMSQYLEENRDFKPEQGEFICKVESCEMLLDGSLLKVTLTDHEGNQYEDHIALRGAMSEVEAQ